MIGCLRSVVAIRRAALLAVLLVAVLLSGTACSKKAAKPAADPRAALAQARTTLDATNALHFTLSGTDIPGGSPAVTAGDGDVARPTSFKGTLTVAGAGLSGHVSVVSVNHVVYAKLPFTNRFVQIDPSQYGFGDPGQLLDRDHGISSLLTSATSVRDKGKVRSGADVLERYDVTFPGDRVAALLTSADPSKDVNGTLDIDPSTHQVRHVVLTGPFFSKTQLSTYTLDLGRYGEPMTISAP